jgi:hypothetical protein
MARQCESVTQIGPAVWVLLLTDKRTGMTNLICALRNLKENGINAKTSSQN